jgi:hypothetical protein
MWILDCDGEQGRTDLAKLQCELGPLPKTWSVETGRVGGGTHFWFRATDGCEDLRTIAHVFGRALDVRGARGHCVLPGSIHKSGIRYRWGFAPDECELAELPEAWREALPKRVEGGVPGRSRSARRVGEGPRVRIEHEASHIIGDGEGRGGFNRPIYARCCQFFGRFGVDRDATKLKDALRNAILNAPRSTDRTSDEIARYASDAYLDSEIENARAFCKGKNA